MPCKDVVKGTRRQLQQIDLELKIESEERNDYKRFTNPIEKEKKEQRALKAKCLLKED